MAVHNEAPWFPAGINAGDELPKCFPISGRRIERHLPSCHTKFRDGAHAAKNVAPCGLPAWLPAVGQTGRLCSCSRAWLQQFAARQCRTPDLPLPLCSCRFPGTPALDRHMSANTGRALPLAAPLRAGTPGCVTADLSAPSRPRRSASGWPPAAASWCESACRPPGCTAPRAPDDSTVQGLNAILAVAKRSRLQHHFSSGSAGDRPVRVPSNDRQESTYADVRRALHAAGS
jgi:hypothetical protein